MADDGWGTLEKMAKQLATDQLAQEDRKTLEFSFTGKDDAKLEGDDQKAFQAFLTQVEAPKRGKGFNSSVKRRVVMNVVRSLMDSGAQGEYAVLGNVEINRKVGNESSHWRSARLDWIKYTYSGSGNRIRSAVEMTQRYFIGTLDFSSSETDVLNMRGEVKNALQRLHKWIKEQMDSLEKERPVMIGDTTITKKHVLGMLRVDLIVAIGCMLPPAFMGLNFSAAEAVKSAGQIIHEYQLPRFVTMGSFQVSPLQVRQLSIQVAWPLQGGRWITRECSINAGIFFNAPNVYNAGVSAPTTELLNQTSQWVTLLVPNAAMATTVMSSGGTNSGDYSNLKDALRGCQSATWLSNERYGSVTIVDESTTWIASANNIVVNDIGNGATATYGEAKCSTLKFFAYNANDRSKHPIIPSVQCVLDSSRRSPIAVSYRESGGMDSSGIVYQFPLILDAKSLACVPMMFTILAKSGSLMKETYAAPRFSMINLSSSYGLETPGELHAHIDYLIGALELLGPFFEELSLLPIDDQDRLDASVRASKEISTHSGAALDSLRGGRSNALTFLRTSDNRNYACAFAWSLVQSSTVIIWLITYLASGVSPVAFPAMWAPPPGEGVTALKFMLTTSFEQWVSKEDLRDDAGRNSLTNPNLRLLKALANSSSGPLSQKLAACKSMILESPNFRSY